MDWDNADLLDDTTSSLGDHDFECEYGGSGVQMDGILFADGDPSSCDCQPIKSDASELWPEYSNYVQAATCYFSYTETTPDDRPVIRKRKATYGWHSLAVMTGEDEVVVPRHIGVPPKPKITEHDTLLTIIPQSELQEVVIENYDVIDEQFVVRGLPSHPTTDTVQIPNDTQRRPVDWIKLKDASLTKLGRLTRQVKFKSLQELQQAGFTHVVVGGFGPKVDQLQKMINSCHKNRQPMVENIKAADLETVFPASEECGTCCKVPIHLVVSSALAATFPCSACHGWCGAPLLAWNSQVGFTGEALGIYCGQLVAANRAVCQCPQ
eukprot:TRINITY_DN67294_c11_g1_i1.p1 TRINITY_DN67294_c11_g1~~TRINITY_DN67294_c11_g1_i1.p1  ORF type:complete len:323 (+),score=24.57 TRINITY_DN67294_c11_g1_i1:61-1029(+)